jgi:hypothetical protein
VIVVSGGLSCEFGFVGLGFRWVQVAESRSLVVVDSLEDTPKNEAPTIWLGEAGSLVRDNLALSITPQSKKAASSYASEHQKTNESTTTEYLQNPLPSKPETESQNP